MINELKIKCDCNSLMEYDSYANKFICPKCHKRYTIKEIDGKEVIVTNSRKAYKMNQVYNKEDFLKKIKTKVKKTILVPKEFSKLDNLNINELEIYLVSYNAKFIIDNTIYELNNLIIDDYLDLDSNIINLLYPIDYNGNFQEIDYNIDNFNELEKISHEYLKDLVNNTNILYLKEEYKVFIYTIYDLEIIYKNNKYHLAMNSYNSKMYMEIPIAKYKFILITLFFLIIDILFFIFIRKEEIYYTFSLILTLIMFLIELISLISLYNLSRVKYQELSSKNKVIINKKNI